MKIFTRVHQNLVVLLLAAAMVLARALDPSTHSLANERTSIERTYELTKYLEHQLKEIKDTYLSYLGPPFNEKDFSPPRPNSTALSLPSAATRLELWRGLENRARLAQNQRAYSVLLAAVKELARSTLCPYLQTSLLHFCRGLDGLLVSISGLMTTLGYALPPPSTSAIGEPPYPHGEAGSDSRRSIWPAPLMMSHNLRKAGTETTRGERSRHDDLPLWARRSDDNKERGGRVEGARRETPKREKGKEGGGRRRAESVDGIGAGRRSRGWRDRVGEERGRRGRRGAGPEGQGWAFESVEEEPERREVDDEEEEEEEEERRAEIWGQRRKLLSVVEEVWEEGERASLPQVELDSDASLWGIGGFSAFRQLDTQTNSNNNNNNNGNIYNYDSYLDNQYSYNLYYQPPRVDTARVEDGVDAGVAGGYLPSSSSSPGHLSHRHPRSPLAPASSTLRPPSLPALSFFYPLGTAEEHAGLLALPQPIPMSLRRASALLSPPLAPLLSSASSAPSAPLSPLLTVRRPVLSDFARKVEGFWILRELQSWLWRSAKDFNRLKKRLRG